MNLLKPFEFFIGLRYLTSRRKQGFISFISLISILGVTTGVMAMVVVLSVMSGLQHDLREKILGTNAHIVTLRSGGAIEEFREIERRIKNSAPESILGTTPFIYNQSMLTTPSSVMGVVIRGVDVASATSVTRLKDYMIDGELSSITSAIHHPHNPDEPALPGMVIGKELAMSLGLYAGDDINVVSPAGSIGPMGVTPKMKRFRIAGIFSSGMYEYDSSLVYISLVNAQDFFGMGERVTGIEVKVKDPENAEEVGWKIQAELGFPYYSRDWKDLNRNLFSALQLEKFGMALILVLIILVAAFNIVSTLFMVVLQKGKEIAILKSMGATNGSIQRIFMLEGLIVGVFGAGIGGALGLILCKILDKYQFIQLPKDVYYIDRLPVRTDPALVGLIIGSAIVVSLLATIYPSWRASKMDPVEGIRYGGEG